MTVIYKKYITREDVKTSNACIFVFGDNDQRVGYGGQAKQMRSEPNAVGIRVKKSPTTAGDSYYTDDEYPENIRKINQDLIHLSEVSKDRIIIFPESGIGTGLARLKITAPKTFGYLNNELKSRFGIVNKG